MLQIPEIPNSASVSHVASRDPVTLTGRRLNRLLKHATPADRALLAHGLAQGTVWVHPLTRGQAARLTKASSGYIGTVARLSERERMRVARSELALSHLHRNPQTRMCRFPASGSSWESLARGAATKRLIVSSSESVRSG